MYSFWIAILKNSLADYVRDQYNEYGPDIQYNTARFDLAEFRALSSENMKNVLGKTLPPSTSIKTRLEMKDFISNLSDRSKLLDDLKVSLYIYYFNRFRSFPQIK